MIDELKKKRLKNEVKDNLINKDLYTKSADILIMVYADMIIQKEILEIQLRDSTDPEVSKILLEALATLKEDIEAYKKDLLIKD